MSGWRKVASEVWCPTCGAAPGVSCANAEGLNRRGSHHWPRYAIARVLADMPLVSSPPKRYRLEPPPFTTTPDLPEHVPPR